MKKTILALASVALMSGCASTYEGLKADFNDVVNIRQHNYKITGDYVREARNINNEYETTVDLVNKQYTSRISQLNDNRMERIQLAYEKRELELKELETRTAEFTR